MMARLPGRVNAWIDRRFVAILVALSLAVAVTIVRRAQVKPFWHDEIYTILASRLPPTRLWTASRDGLDLSPPLNTILTHLIHGAAGVGRVTTRVPPLVGFMTAFGLIAVMVRRRSNAMLGIAAALMLCYTAGYSFAYEARGYSVMTGCFAVALYTWSEYAAGRSGRPAVAGLSLALAAGLWTHYYFVLAFLPIVCGEVARQWHRRRIDLAMWAAIAVSALAAAPLWLLLRTAMAQTETFWARLPHPSVWAVYSALLGILLGSPFPAVAAVIIMLIIAGRVRRSMRSNGRTLPVHEVVAGLACLAIPACAVLIARTIGHNVLVPRYVMFATAGFALVLPLLVWRVAPATGVVDAVIFTVLVLLFTRTLWRTFEPRRLVYVDRMAQYPLLTKQIDTGELTVVTGGTDFVELWYHTPRDRRAHLVYLADPEHELQLTRTDSVDRGYLALARWSGVSILPADPFLASHRDFAFYDCGASWIRTRLQDLGASFDERGHDRKGTLYRVRLPAS